MKKAVIIGATSGIGRALAQLMLKKGYIVGGCGRRSDVLQRMKEELGATFHYAVLDIQQVETIPGQLKRLIETMGGMDICVIASGVSGKNRNLQWDIEYNILQTNVIGWARCAVFAMNYFNEQNAGHLVGISSIARNFGYYNPAYNASKAFEDIYMSGLALRAKHLPISVTTVHPGFVYTEMTSGRTRMFWAVTAERAAESLLRAIEKKQSIAYVTPRWRYIDWLLHWLPGRLLKKLL